MKTIEDQLEIIRRGAREIISEEELIEKIKKAQVQGRPLRVKLGIDPTARDVHLGWTVVLRKLRQFQDLGHEAQLIVGDFTAMIGDPSGKSKTRPQLSKEEVDKNAEACLGQIFRILDREKTRIHFNSEWLGKMNFADVIRLASRCTVARTLERDDFAKRYAENRPIGLHEFLYPLCQGYDSVAIESDVEMGGNDQKFNNLVGRELQREMGQEPQVVLMMPLLVGIDGTEKMSQSLGNYVGITETPDQMYGKLMSVPDELMRDYFELCTDVPMQEVEALLQGHPKEAKQRLAREVVSIYHTVEAGQAAEREFEQVFAQHQLPSDIPEVIVAFSELVEGGMGIIKLILRCHFASSTREARRLVEQGGVSFDGAKISNHEQHVKIVSGLVLAVGKRKYARILLSE